VASRRDGSRLGLWAELDPDHEAALRRLRAAVGFIEALEAVDHNDQEQDDEPLEEGEETPAGGR
jgi:ferric-dicitrate binding protein FerR (iron transport regulator)